jgi:hypothetical protein
MMMMMIMVMKKKKTTVDVGDHEILRKYKSACWRVQYWSMFGRWRIFIFSLLGKQLFAFVFACISKSAFGKHALDEGIQCCATRTFRVL